MQKQQSPTSQWGDLYAKEWKPQSSPQRETVAKSVAFSLDDDDNAPPTIMRVVSISPPDSDEIPTGKTDWKIFLVNAVIAGLISLLITEILINLIGRRTSPRVLTFIAGATSFVVGVTPYLKKVTDIRNFPAVTKKIQNLTQTL